MAAGPDEKPKENIFQIMDGIIEQIDRTKKIFIIMILSIMIIPPISFAVTYSLFGPPFPFGGFHGPRGGVEPPAFVFVRYVPFFIALFWLGFGIRQWFVLSKWTKKYKQYKKMQEEIDKKLGDEQPES